MFQRDNAFTMGTPIVILLTIIICPQMHMSWSDVKGAALGAVSLAGAVLMLSFVFDFIPDGMMAQILNILNTFVVYYTYALILGLVMSTAMTACLSPVSLVRRRMW